MAHTMYLLSVLPLYRDVAPVIHLVQVEHCALPTHTRINGFGFRFRVSVNGQNNFLRKISPTGLVDKLRKAVP